MSIKKLLTIGFIILSLVFAGCFSTDSDDDNKKDNPIDSVTAQTILDSLAELAGSTEVDSSMIYTKTGTTFKMWEKDSASEDDTITFTATISGNSAALTMLFVEEGESVTVTMNTSKLLGTGATFDGTAWQMASIKMATSDTFAIYTLGASEIEIFYMTAGKVYMVENNVSIDSIFEILALEIMGVEPIDSTEALDTLATIAGTDGIDSSMSYILNNNTLGIFETNDTTNLGIEISAGELTLKMDLDDGSTIEEKFDLFMGSGSVEGSIWQLTDVTASNNDTSVDYTLSTNEVFLAYFNNGKFYVVEKGVNVYEDIISSLVDALIGYGNPVGKWYVEIYENLYIKTDTSFSSDTLYGDTVFTILDISAGKFITYDYDDEEMVIEVEEHMVDVSTGGTIILDANKSIEVMEEDGVLTFTIVSDYTDYNEGYHEETLICKPFTGTIPPAYWVVDTAIYDSATLLTTDGSVDTGFIDSSNDVDIYKFNAEAGKVYQIVGAELDEDANIGMDLYYMNGTLKVYVKDEENELMIKASSAMTYYIDVYTYDDTLNYTIFVKTIDAITTPAGVINNWYCSSMPISDSFALTFTQDSSVFYATITSDSITVYMQSNGVKQTMTDIIVFANGNKCYFFGEEFDYALSGTTMSMTGSDMAFVWTVFSGTSFPPDKYVDFGVLQNMGGNRKILGMK